jgi:hypothetical protein
MKEKTIDILRQVFLQNTQEIIEARRAILDGYETGLAVTDALGHAIKDCIDTFERRRKDLKHVSVNKMTTGKFKTGVAALDEQVRIQSGKVKQSTTTKKDPRKREATWGKTEEYLYHDIIHLFDINDQNGALISFERLMMLASPTKEFRQFLEKNQGKLYEVYEKYFVSFDRIPVQLKNPEKCDIPAFNQKMVQSVFSLGSGRRTVAQILVQTKYSPVETLATLSHLIRSGLLDLT